MDGIIVDFCDGDICANHPLFSRDPRAIQILLYYDDVEVVNPLGSKTSKHKFGTLNCCYSLIALYKILYAWTDVSICTWLLPLTLLCISSYPNSTCIDNSFFFVCWLYYLYLNVLL